MDKRQHFRHYSEQQPQQSSRQQQASSAQFKSVSDLDSRTKEQRDRLLWLFEQIITLRRAKGLGPVPWYPNEKAGECAVYQDMYRFWKTKAVFEVIVIYHDSYGHLPNYYDELSYDGHLWLADQWFFNKCECTYGDKAYAPILGGERE